MSTKSDFNSTLSGELADLNSDCLITCPYDSAHRLLPSRLALHLTRCSRNHPGSKMVRCPFNTTHVLKVSDMKDHVMTCEFRKSFELFVQPDKLPPPAAPTANNEVLVPSTEDWDAEPATKGYDPRKYCERNLLIRNPQGRAPAERREFRERERQRFMDIEKNQRPL